MIMMAMPMAHPMMNDALSLIDHLYRYESGAIGVEVHFHLFGRIAPDARSKFFDMEHIAGICWDMLHDADEIGSICKRALYKITYFHISSQLE